MADRTPKFPIADIFAATTGNAIKTVEPPADSPRHLPPDDDVK
jgi:hypothetical protein